MEPNRFWFVFETTSLRQPQADTYTSSFDIIYIRIHYNSQYGTGTGTGVVAALFLSSVVQFLAYVSFMSLQQGSGNADRNRHNSDRKPVRYGRSGTTTGGGSGRRTTRRWRSGRRRGCRRKRRGGGWSRGGRIGDDRGRSGSDGDILLSGTTRIGTQLPDFWDLLLLIGFGCTRAVDVVFLVLRKIPDREAFNRCTRGPAQNRIGNVRGGKITLRVVGTTGQIVVLLPSPQHYDHRGHPLV